MRLKTDTIEREIIRQARSYKQVADMAQITEKTLKNARIGREIRTTTAGNLAAALGLPVDKIIDD